MEVAGMGKEWKARVAGHSLLYPSHIISVFNPNSAHSQCGVLLGSTEKFCLQLAKRVCSRLKPPLEFKQHIVPQKVCNHTTHLVPSPPSQLPRKLRHTKCFKCLCCNCITPGVLNRIPPYKTTKEVKYSPSLRRKRTEPRAQSVSEKWLGSHATSNSP